MVNKIYKKIKEMWEWVGTFFRGGFSIKDQQHFAQRLAFLVKAGVPILQSLRILLEQTKSVHKKKIFESLITDVSQGQYLSTSLNKFKNIFGDFAVNIIQVGETSGILSENLNYLADELKKKRALRQKIQGALVYPVFITVATVGITILLTAYIFPKILPIFESLHIKLPWTTRVIIVLSDFSHRYGLLLSVVIVAFIIGLFVTRKKVAKVRFFVDKLLLKIPIVGHIAESYNMTNFCRTLGLLLKSGISITTGLEITARTTTNMVYKKEYERMFQNVNQGERISVYINSTRGLFPDILAHMIAIGETTGNLSDTLLYLSEFHEREVDDLTRNLSNSIEPLLMISMGLVVGFVAVSIITPIYEVTQNLHH